MRALFLLLLLATSSLAEIIPATRAYPWEAGVTVGVQGGITERSTIGATVDAATYGNDSTDALAAIQAAYDATPTGQVCYIPAGTYRMSNRLYRSAGDNKTIRGAGQGQTILKAMTDTQEVFRFGSINYPRPSTALAITAGATRGSTVVTVASTAGIEVGDFVRLQQSDPSYVIYNGAPDTDQHGFSFMVRVTGLTSTTVTFSHALPINLVSSPELVHYSGAPLVGIGIEDLTIDCNSLSAVPVTMEKVWGGWIDNVEIKNSKGFAMNLIAFLASEVRNCYVHNTINGGPGTEGITLYLDCAWSLVENNVVYGGGFPGICIGNGTGSNAGNVLGYNFSYNANTGDPSVAGADLSVNHGAHNSFNLVEGNVVGGFIDDGYHGSASHNTYLRNWVTIKHPTGTLNLFGMRACRWSNYINFVGNILGDTTFTPASANIYQLGFPNLGNSSFSGTWGPTDPPNYRGQAANQVGGNGHGSGGNTLQEKDLNVEATMFRHGNYDYDGDAIVWDGSTADHSIPVSLYRSTKHAMFGTLSWPTFDPASPPGAFNDGSLATHPAGYRFVNGSTPPAAESANKRSRWGGKELRVNGKVIEVGNN